MKTYTYLALINSSRWMRLAVVLVLAGASTLAFAGAIHDAARKGDAKKVAALLQSDPKLVGDRDKNGDTPLHVAALHGEVGVAQVLLEAGADINARNNYGAFTPGDLWGVLGSSNHKDPVSLLSVHGVDAQDMKNGYTPLHLAMF